MNDFDEFKIWYTQKAPDESEVTMVDMAAMAWQAARATAPEGMAIVPVIPTPAMFEAAIYHAMRETDDDKYRAIGMIRCVWDEMLAATKETTN